MDRLWFRTLITLLIMTMTAPLGIVWAQGPVRELAYNWTADYGGVRFDPGKGFTILGADLYLGLVRLDQSNKAVPGAAERWEVSKDGMTYTFFLRTGLKWSDGQPLTAGDFEFSWKRALDPKFQSVRAFMLYALKGARAYNTGETTDPNTIGVKAIDDSRLRVDLEYPAPYLIPFMAANNVWYAAPEHAWRKHGSNWTRVENLVASGPFMVREYAPRSRIVLVPNPNYALQKPQIDRVVNYVIPEATTALAMYERGQLNLLIGVPIGEISRIQSDPQLSKQMGIIAEGRTMMLNFNVTVPPFTDVRVRRALSMAIDQDVISKGPFRGVLKPAFSIRPPQFAEAGVRSAIFNPEGAKKLLAEAGYPQGQGLAKITILTRQEEDSLLAAQAVQAQLKQHLGLDVEVQVMESTAFLSFTQSGKAQAFVSAVFSLSPDMYDLFGVVEGNATNNSRWRSAGFTNLLIRAARQQDPKAREQLYRQAENLFLREAAVSVPLYYPEKVSLQKPNVSGIIGVDKRPFPHTHEYVIVR